MTEDKKKSLRNIGLVLLFIYAGGNLLMRNKSTAQAPSPLERDLKAALEVLPTSAFEKCFTWGSPDKNPTTIIYHVKVNPEKGTSCSVFRDPAKDGRTGKITVISFPDKIDDVTCMAAALACADPVALKERAAKAGIKLTIEPVAVEKSK